MTSLIDITRPLHPGMPCWPGDPPLERKETVVRVGDHLCRSSHLCLSAHAGTHLDAPAHLVPDPSGSLFAGDAGFAFSEEPEPALAPATVDQLQLDILMGQARVVDLRGQEAIIAQSIRDLPDCPARLLLRTDNSERPYAMEGFVALEPEAAEALLSRACLLVGIDGPSVDPADSVDLPAHRVLLGAGVVIIEGLDLSRAAAGDYQLVCLPLLLRGADGAPVRAVLQTEP